MLLDYVIQNWALLLLGLAFVISLKISGFQDKSSVKRMYILIAVVFLLSIVVFEEFYLADHGGHLKTRTILMAVRYSATPLIVTMVLFTLQKKQSGSSLSPPWRSRPSISFRSSPASSSACRRTERCSAARWAIFRISWPGFTAFSCSGPCTEKATSCIRKSSRLPFSASLLLPAFSSRSCSE